MPSWKVLITAPYLIRVLDEYRSLFETHNIQVRMVTVRERLDQEALFPLVADVDGVICGDDRFTEKVLDAAPRLKVIAKWGTGIDSIDVEAARRRGIKVLNTPGAFTDPVADTVMGYILMFARRLLEMDRNMRAGKWEKLEARALNECTLGVVGVGNIGKAVVHRARAFGMRVLGHDIVSLPESFITETGLEVTDLGTLLEASDFVSLNCDLNPTSYHLIGENELRRMKPTAYLINTARGPVVDERALIRALEEGWIAGAALDVFEAEPLPADSPLRRLENCLLAPHNANSSPSAWRRVHESTIRRLIEALEQAEREA